MFIVLWRYKFVTEIGMFFHGRLLHACLSDGQQYSYICTRGVDKYLDPPNFWSILFDGENISFDATLVIYIYINSTNIPQIIIINKIYETQNLLSL